MKKQNKPHISTVTNSNFESPIGLWLSDDSLQKKTKLVVSGSRKFRIFDEISEKRKKDLYNEIHYFLSAALKVGYNIPNEAMLTNGQIFFKDGKLEEVRLDLLIQATDQGQINEIIEVPTSNLSPTFFQKFRARTLQFGNPVSIVKKNQIESPELSENDRGRCHWSMISVGDENTAFFWSIWDFTENHEIAKADYQKHRN